MGTAGSGGVNVSTLNGATSALANIDALLIKYQVLEPLLAQLKTG